MKFKFTTLHKTILTALAIGLVGFFSFAILLHPIFSGYIEMPQYIPIGKLHIQLYGLFIAAAALAGYWMVLKRRQEYNIDAKESENIFFVVMVSGFVGARIYHVVSQFGFYIHDVKQIFAIWNGGLGIYGAVLGGLIGLIIYQRYRPHQSLLRLLDWLIPGVALGQIIGRFGNFVNYELYGSPTTLPWKMFVPPSFRMPPLEIYQFSHPLFLYEAVGSLVIIVLLLRLKVRRGYLFLLWLFLYNILRFLLEFIRVGSVIYGGIRVNAIVSLALAIIAILVWYRIKQTDNVLSHPSHN
jgi:phosphatidylglycerol---prolipoprotein diacylglyceryl transferase